MLTQKALKQNLYISLQEIGLTDQEINLYVLSLALGPVAIATLAKHLAIPRPNVYKLIGGLEEHGLARFSERKKYTKTFVVEPPALLLKKLKEKRDGINALTHTVSELMPDLYGLYHQGADQTKVKVLKTEKEYIDAVEGMLNEAAGEIHFFGSFDDFLYSITPAVFEKFTELRVARQIVAKTLCLPTKYEALLRRRRTDDLRELRILRGSLPFHTSCQFSRHSVILWQPQTPLALLVEDQAMVAMLHAMFEMLWKSHGV
jgi:sugar-specific transcriptional regulator TrmB